MSGEKGSFSRAKKNAEIAMERAEQERRLLMLRRRIDLAQAGVRHYEMRKMAEAVKSFQSYLHILEDWKNVSEGRLTPQLFNVKDDVAELLLISGIYWDLAKLYDRTKSKEALFKHYMDKYVLFTKGMPYQTVCMETMRKYIGNDKPIHKAEFRNAYKALGGSNCFVATALIDVTEDGTLPKLQAFRDQVLLRSRVGRVSVRAYYWGGPYLAKVTDRAPETIRRLMGRGLDLLAKRLSRSN